MKTKYILVVLIALTGCRYTDQQEEIDALHAQHDQRLIEIADLQEDLANQKREKDDEIDRLQRDLNEQGRTYKDLLDKAETTLAARNKQIAELEYELTQARNGIIRLKADYDSRIVQLQQQLSRKQAPAPTPRPTREEPAFPLDIAMVSGRRIVTGTHQTSKYVELETEKRNEFGEMKKEGTWKRIDVNEYAYRVTFNVSNTTKRVLTFSARAGIQDKQMTIKPGEYLENISINAARGSDLMITQGGHIQTFPVAYIIDTGTLPTPTQSAPLPPVP